MNNRVFITLIILATCGYAGIFVLPAILNHRIENADLDNDSDNLSTSTDEFSDDSSAPDASGPRLSKEAIAKHYKDVLKIEAKIIRLARGGTSEQKQAVETTEKLFSVLKQRPGWFREFAGPVRDSLRTELPRSEAAAVAEEAIIARRYESGNVSKQLINEMVAFANAYDSKRPVNVIRRTANDLVARDKSLQAIRLLEITLEGLREGEDHLAIRQHLQMTQRMALTRPVRVDRSPFDTSPIRKEKSKGRHANLIGQTIDISGPTANGRHISTRSMRGNYVVVHFWATWCGPCVRGMPKFNSESRALASYGVQVVGVCLDSDEKKMAKFLRKQNIVWPNIVGSGGRSGWNHPLVKELGITAIPTNIVLGPDGRIAATDISLKEVKTLVGGFGNARDVRPRHRGIADAQHAALIPSSFSMQ